MSFGLTIDWLAAGQDPRPESASTTGLLGIYLDKLSLTEAEDIWSKTIRSSVLVSAYPLAMWFAASWWRLNWEPLPARRKQPNVDWRMSHEIGAANDGYVWPQVVFASDGQAVQIWAVASTPNASQSVRYLNGLDRPFSVSIAEFERGVDEFISTVLTRLEAMNCAKSDLAGLWGLIQEDRADKEKYHYRKLEAQMGWDPDECPDAFMKVALELFEKLGAETLSELAPIYSERLNHITDLASSLGVSGRPDVPNVRIDNPPNTPPWKAAVNVARELRQVTDSATEPMSNKVLCSLLGVRTREFEEWSPSQQEEAALGVPRDNQQYTFSLRKRHPAAKRFELARLLGDYLLTRGNQAWLASTELPTYRQKFQKAFAAEFLSPIGAVEEYLAGDYSDPATEDAADHFQVSSRTIDASLANNGLLSRYSVDFSQGTPYRVGTASW